MENSLATAPFLAEQIATAFPELQGRAIAVSNHTVTAENVPTLPLAMVALDNEPAAHAYKSNGRIEIEERYIVEFWLKPERYKTGDGGETPFWAYFDFDSLRDKMIGLLLSFRTPRKGLLEYRGLNVDAMHFAVVVSFNVSHHFEYCELDEEPTCVLGLPQDGMVPRIQVSIENQTQVDYTSVRQRVVDPCADGENCPTTEE